MRDLLKKKPEPNRKKIRKLKIVRKKATIINKTNEGYDRAKFLQRYRNKGIAISSKSSILKDIEKKVEAQVVEAESKREVLDIPSKPVVPEKAISVPKTKKKRKRMKLTLGKTIKPAVEPEDESGGGGESKEQTVRPPAKEVLESTILTTPNLKIVIGEDSIESRLPENDIPIRVRVSRYYLNNREFFVNFINSNFEKYKDAIEKESKEASCSTSIGKFKPLTHQEVVRDYINLYTPYRGLLIYHGLGSGKTCASIGIAESYANIAMAEGIKNAGEIIVMTPASLRKNYVNDLKKCGDPLYRLNQFWEFVETEGNETLISTMSSSLKLSLDTIRKNGGAWFVNIKKEPNYESLTADEKAQLNNQIDEMIRSKYRFLNYNGLRNDHIKGLTENGKINPFSNKVVIIDEAHNFVSRIVNKLRRPDCLSMQLYHLLMDAEYCRIVFLTGTPIINYPNEAAVLFNMLRGYIKTFIFSLSTRPTQNDLNNIIQKSGAKHDYVQYENSKTALIVTRNPFGFVNDYKNKRYKGLRFTKAGSLTDDNFIKIMKTNLKSVNINVVSVKKKNEKCLPDDLDIFRAKFINDADQSLKNSDLLKRRIMGLSSFFKSPREELMPKFNELEDFKVVEIPMSDTQFLLYEEVRANERDQERRNAIKRKRAGDDLYTDTVSTYRIFSRAFCNFVFPKEIGRPMPRKSKDVADNTNEDDLDNADIQLRLDNVDGAHIRDDEALVEKEIGERLDDDYETRIKTAIDKLKEGSSQYLSETGLATYSPKFLEIYRRIVENDGLHLVYSQFRTLEGIGLFTLALKENGFAQFDIVNTKERGWVLNIPEEDEAKPKFALFTGTEDVEKKDFMRLIFNGEWDKIPTNLAEEIRSKYGDNNRMGEVIKTLMITSSGAEGINLKNTRFVHIMEPYWHPVRTEQVIGRARRICSHQELPAELRNVTVYIYLMKFTEKQLQPKATGGMAPNGLLEKDLSKKDKKTVFTSDQALFEIANMKKEISDHLLTAIKESSIDCPLYSKEGDGLKCVTFSSGSDTSRFATEPAITQEKAADQQRKRNLKKITWKAKKVTIPWYGKKKTFAFRPDGPGKKTGKLYDAKSYANAKKQGGDPILVGNIIVNDSGALEIEPIAK
jgi:hypothetical protein|uniref:Helicase ATP-binding domain-containing protein n=1 Tax=viral metagenome TaxID=1070528 RepID=A0A6C0BYI0_9ZZZZ